MGSNVVQVSLEDRPSRDLPIAGMLLRGEQVAYNRAPVDFNGVLSSIACPLGQSHILRSISRRGCRGLTDS